MRELRVEELGFVSGADAVGNAAIGVGNAMCTGGGVAIGKGGWIGTAAGLALVGAGSSLIAWGQTRNEQTSGGNVGGGGGGSEGGHGPGDDPPGGNIPIGPIGPPDDGDQLCKNPGPGCIIVLGV